MARPVPHGGRHASATEFSDTLIVPIAEIGGRGAVVIAPPAVSPANFLPRQDSREELQRDCHGDSSHVQNSKPRKNSESWPLVGKGVSRRKPAVDDTMLSRDTKRKSYAGSAGVWPTVEDRIEAARRAYEQGSNRKASRARAAISFAVLDPLDHMRDQHEQVTKQQKVIARAVESRIDYASRAIPLKFLLEKEERHVYAGRVLVRRMCRTLHRHYMRVIRVALLSWKKRTLTLRILEEEARKLFLLRQASLAHASAIIQRQILARQHLLLTRWKHTTDSLRRHDRVQRAMIIQKCWRSCSMKKKLKMLALFHRQRVRDTSALVIQCALRCYLARCEMTRLKYSRRIHAAALCIQQTYRHYVLLQIANRHRQTLAAVGFQRMWGGQVGREKALCRRNLIRNAARLTYENLWIQHALQLAIRTHSAATCIQQHCRLFLHRRYLNSGIRRAHQRRLFLRAYQIQRAWLCYRANEVRFICDGLVIRVLMTHLSAARRIQQCFRAYWSAKIDVASRRITGLFYQFRARRELINVHILAWLRVWSDSYLQKWRTLCGRRGDSTWTRLLDSLTCEIVSYKNDQLVESRRLNVNSGLQLLRHLKGCHTYFLEAHATQIQHVWRWHRICIIIRRLQHAVQLLRRAIPEIYRHYKQRKRRHRVLQRWRRARYIVLHGHFETWKLHHLLLTEERDLSTTTHKRRKAIWFHYQVSRQRVFRCWLSYVDLRRVKKAKANTAVAHDRIVKLRKVWRYWNRDALPCMCCSNRLHVLTMTITMWGAWEDFKLRKLSFKAARAHRKRWVLLTAFRRWQVDRDEFVHSLCEAAQMGDKLIVKHVFYSLHRYVVRTSQARAFFREKQFRNSVRRWLLHVYAMQRNRDQHCLGLAFRRKLLAQSTMRQWSRYVQHRAQRRTKDQEMRDYYKCRRLRISLRRWHMEFVPLSNDNRILHIIADAYRSRKLLEVYFRDGFREFWGLTAGARRIAMAVRIQRAFRSKRARHKIFVVRMKIRYQLEKRALTGADTTDFSTATLQAALTSTAWVFVLFSMPWSPVSKPVKEAFCKTATSWVYVRKQGHQMVFGNAFATSMIKLSNQDEFSLMSWFGLQATQLPCVVAFWNGIGPASPTDRVSRLPAGSDFNLKRRYKIVCGRQRDGQSLLVYPTENSSPFVMSRLISWIEHVQDTAREATAVDLQSYVRGFLARRHTKRSRIINRERRKQLVRVCVRKLVKKWHMAKCERAAMQIQRWFRHLLYRRKFWRSFRNEMDATKTAIHRLQRIIRLHLTRVRFRSGLASLLATAERYPNAPLCQECFDHTLAKLFCRDCQQPYCSNCFAKTHKSGKRMLHLCDSIDFASFESVLSCLCSLCEVRRASRVCQTCVVEGNCEKVVMCTPCFERKHSDEHDPARAKPSRIIPWWRSERFQKHMWERMGMRYESSPIRATQACHLTASMVMEKHQWQSKALVLQRQQQVAESDKLNREREEKLLIIRLQHEAILRDAFDRFDSDKSGAIDRDEFKRMFKEELCEPLSDAQVVEAMKCMDKSGNGLVEFNELLSWFALDTLDRNDNGSRVNEPRTLIMLKDALRAKRQIRRYKEKLNEFVPSVSLRVSSSTLNSTLSQLIEKKTQKKTVPGFPAVQHLEHADFARKRRVFYRFVQEICGLDWIYEDEPTIPINNIMAVFDEVFVPRWNAGELTYDFYFDDESFEFEGEEWQRKWIPETKKYVFTTTRRKTRRVDVSEDHTGRRKRHKRDLSSAHPVGVIEVEESVEIVEVIDPRRKRMLLEEAKVAFKNADSDGSGYIDEHEFYKMLNRELCEPVSRAKVRQIMRQLDADGSGKIDFHEFFQWYAVDKCQDYPLTPEMERARGLLRTRRRAKAAAVAAFQISLTGGLHLKEAINRRRKEQQLAKDCRGASAELIELLHEGFGKLLAEKALALHNQDVAFARKWLQDKQLSEENERAHIAQESAARKAQAKKEARAKKQKRQQRIAAVRKHLKLLLIGPSKKEAHVARVEQALTNLDREIRMVEHQLTFKR